MNEIKNKNHKIIVLICLSAALFCLTVCFFAVRPTMADVELDNPLGTVKGVDDIPALAKTIINSVLGVIGAIALVVFIYGGVTILTSAGRPDWVKRGWDIITWSITGLITIFVAYVALRFILTGLATPTTAPAPTPIAEFTCQKTSGQSCKPGKEICPADMDKAVGTCPENQTCCKVKAASSTPPAQEQCASQQQPAQNVGPCEGCWNPSDPTNTFQTFVQGGKNGWAFLSNKTCPGNYQCWKCTGTVADGPGCSKDYVKKDCP